MGSLHSDLRTQTDESLPEKSPVGGQLRGDEAPLFHVVITDNGRTSPFDSEAKRKRPACEDRQIYLEKKDFAQLFLNRSGVLIQRIKTRLESLRSHTRSIPLI